MDYEEEDGVVEEEVGNRTIDVSGAPLAPTPNLTRQLQEYDFVEPGPSELNGKRSLLRERIFPKLVSPFSRKSLSSADPKTLQGIKPKAKESELQSQHSWLATC